MQNRTNGLAATAGLIVFVWQAAAWGQSLEADLRALDALRAGFQTPLDVVDRQGDALLEKYERPSDQAQIHYMLAHVHAQSGMREPKRIIEYAEAALDSQLVTPQQRGTLYSYLSSAHQVDRTEKDFAAARRKALAPLLAGLQELQAFDLPAVAPELPAPPAFERFRGEEHPGDEAVARQRAEAHWAARRQAQQTRDLVQRRDVLKIQIKGLYVRDPPADDELRELAGESLGEARAAELVEAADDERERIAKARQERQKARESRQ